MELILASGSPRRRELIKNCGYEFTVVPSRAEEKARGGSPRKLASELAAGKAMDVFLSLPKDRRGGAAVIGSDTVVALGGKLLGKPADAEEAKAMLRMESGRENRVSTGLCVIAPAAALKEEPGAPISVSRFTAEGTEAVVLSACDTARVRFAKLADEEIEEYVRSGDPLDKAGAYGIQGAFSAHIESVSGSYFTVVGLPVHLLYRMLSSLGIARKL